MRRKLFWMAPIALAAAAGILYKTHSPGHKRQAVLAERPTPLQLAPNQVPDPQIAPAPPPLPGPPLVARQPVTVESALSPSITLTQAPMQAAAPAKPASKKKTLRDPLARDALALVGIDPDAETYWFEAIQDPSLPKSERQDLIDDLNEEGFIDPKHPSPEELPLILNRLEVLEELAPTLPDEFDWKECYGDLLNLADVAMGGGKPVK